MPSPPLPYPAGSDPVRTTLEGAADPDFVAITLDDLVARLARVRLSILSVRDQWADLERSRYPIRTQSVLDDLPDFLSHCMNEIDAIIAAAQSTEGSAP